MVAGAAGFPKPEKDDKLDCCGCPNMDPVLDPNGPVEADAGCCGCCKFPDPNKPDPNDGAALALAEGWDPNIEVVGC